MLQAEVIHAQESNTDILLEALKQIGCRATVRELTKFLWEPENRVKFQRHGRAWSEHFVQRDMHYLMKEGRVWGVPDGSSCGRLDYYVSPEEFLK